MSYHIPGTFLLCTHPRLAYLKAASLTFSLFRISLGFRQSSEWFPREIYYTRTKAQVAEYEKKVLGKKQDDGDGGELTSRKEQSDPTELQQLRTQIDDLFKQQAELIKQQEDNRQHNVIM